MALFVCGALSSTAVFSVVALGNGHIVLSSKEAKTELPNTGLTSNLGLWVCGFSVLLNILLVLRDIRENVR